MTAEVTAEQPTGSAVLYLGRGLAGRVARNPMPPGACELRGVVTFAQLGLLAPRVRPMIAARVLPEPRPLENRRAA